MNAATRFHGPVDVLVAEDSRTQAELLKSLLQDQGWRVSTTGDGRRALEAARERKPTLVITDIVMPEMDGYALCKAIKGDDELRDVPVMIVTALSGIQEIVMALECGADNFIRKPYEPEELVDRVHYILSNRELRTHRGGRRQPGLEIFLGGRRHFITSQREQILDLLVASYEQALRANEDLKKRDHVISALNADLVRHAASLEAANAELEAFSHSVSHDLRAPLVSIDGFTARLQKDCGSMLDARGNDHLRRVRDSVQRMSRLIDDMLYLSKVTRGELQREEVDLARIAHEIVAELRAAHPARNVHFVAPARAVAECDPRLMRIVVQNLIGNAWKFTARREEARIEFGVTDEPGSAPVFHVRDNGAGFDMQQAGTLFTPFQRLHADADFPGTGVGLATVQRVIQRHGGKLWAEAAVDRGAAFHFTLTSAA
ncbi:MAG TPA: response regulator [Ramlibacter sp.]|uniref:sensor histidine kinase n=1 Tax=Ramlibacter sp. TaxID=1917967 RepID=UPI002BA84FA9|nr:response regulator [Ramlibacter sp.]HVZ43469.1 response regulator [Ramlibacter sp.]